MKHKILISLCCLGILVFASGNSVYALENFNEVEDKLKKLILEKFIWENMIVRPLPTIILRPTITPRPTATPFPTRVPPPTRTPTPIRRPKATPTRIPTATSTPSITPKITSTPVPTGIPTPTTPSSGSGLAVGPFYLPSSLYGKSVYTASFVSLTPETAISTLNSARNAKMRLLINLAGTRNNFQNTDKSFSLILFQSQLNRFAGIDFGPFVADGTIIGHMVLDEPQDGRGNWNGLSVPLSDIDGAAAYSKKLWPALLTGVGSNACFLAGRAWQSLDFVSTPFTETKLNSIDACGKTYNTVQAWKDGQVSQTKLDGLGLVLSINVLDGGTPKGEEVGASKLQEYGTIFAGDPYTCALTFWKWDTADSGAFFGKIDVSLAMGEIMKAAKNRNSLSCKKLS